MAAILEPGGRAQDLHGNGAPAATRRLLQPGMGVAVFENAAPAEDLHACTLHGQVGAQSLEEDPSPSVDQYIDSRGRRCGPAHAAHWREGDAHGLPRACNITVGQHGFELLTLGTGESLETKGPVPGPAEGLREA